MHSRNSTTPCHTTPNTRPDDALLSVSKKFLASSNLGSEAVTDAIAQTCLHIHRSVEEASTRFYAELRRHFYTTPKSYLDLISLYLQLLQERKSTLQHSCERLLNGVNKLNETEALVTSMKADLANLQPVLEAKAAATAELLVKVLADQQEAEKVKIVVAAEEQEIGVMQQRTHAMADEAKADLAEAMPALQAAIDSLKALNKNDIVEIKSFTKPPDLVQTTMEAVCILKREKPDWDTAKRVLSDTNFMCSLEEFDKDHIPDAVIHKLKKYIDNPRYQPDLVAKQSRAAMSLCMWTRAMDVYNRVSKVVEPKRKKLAEAEAQLEAANSQLKAKQDALAAVVQRVNNLKQQLADAESEQRQLNAQAELTRKRLERANKLTSGLSEEGVRWQATAEQLQRQIELLVGDVFVSAACIAYYGAFTGSYRERLVKGWVAKCKELSIPVSETMTLCGTLANPIEVRDWMLAGLPSDSTSVDNGILVTRGKRWPLMIDPQGQASSWVKALEGRNGLKVIRLSDPNFLRTLENCIRIGSPCLIEDVGEALDPALEPVLQRANFKQGGRLLIRLGDTDVDYDPSFKLFITTKLANPHYFPETCIKVTLINFTVTMQGLEDQLLAEVVRQERPELEEQRDRLVVSIAADKGQLQELEEKILKLLRESEGNILDDEQLLNTLNNSKRTSAAIQMRVKEAEETERNINTAREAYRTAATRGSILYFTVADLAGINPMYQFSLAYFARMFSQCITDSAKSDDVATRLQLLSDHTTSFVFKIVSRGLFEQHKRLFSFLLCTSILRHQPTATDGIPETKWSCLIRGPVTALACQQGAAANTSHGRPKPPQLEWLSEQSWEGLQALEQCLPQLQGLTDSWQQEAAAWKHWHSSAEPHQQPLPEPWQRLSSSFPQLLLIHLLRAECFVPAAHQYVSQHLGREFTEPEPWTLNEVFEETTAKTPIVFILITGADPTSMLQRFGERKGWQLGGRLHVVSLGQGQGILAETMIKQAAASGDWVCLQNCHLAASWMRRLEGQVEELSHSTISGQPVHPDFRLWLTSMPSPVFPVPVLQNAIKLTSEPPKGVKANLARSYSHMGHGVLDSCPSKPNEWRRLLFALSMFHAVVQERRKFGSLGFNICYEFNASDLECSSSTLNMFLSSQDAIPWEALEYVIGQVNYGGRVTDDLDRRCLMSVLRQFINPRVVQQECAALTASGAYCVPKDGSIESYLQSIRAMPTTESPEVFGMHSNANITFQQQETRDLLDAVVSIQPRVSSAGGGGANSTDAIVAALCADILQQMPDDLSLEEAAPGLFERSSSDGKLNSLSVVLGQEVERFRRLSGVMRSSLAQLQAAIKGLVVMSEPLEAAYNALLSNEVPEVWAQVAYPSLKPLASWIRDYAARIAFMRSWLRQGPPACFWLPGFFFPQGFLTGMLQMHARKYALPINSLSYSVQVTEQLTAADVGGPPEDGIYVDGLWLEGAHWDADARCLAASEPGVMCAPLPVVHFTPAANYTPPADEYACPLYKTSARVGVLSTTGCSTNFVLCVSLPVGGQDNRSSSSSRPSDGGAVDAWVLQGVALLCQLDS